VFLLAGIAWSAPAWAEGEGGSGGAGEPPPEEGEGGPQSSGISATQTNYVGAVMLRGGEDVTMESVVPGYVGDESYQADGRYGYFSGNTLYAGGKDDQGNYVDMIAEFFWFESSVDRGADFYVGVVKARTSPALPDWVLERQGDSFVHGFLPDHEATLYLRAQTDIGQGETSFRWDWSVPFDNYGWDAYGNISMKTEYGLSVNAEGSAQKALTYVNGVEAEANVQAKGFLNHDYKVTTQYEVTLWRWEVVVHGSADEIAWQMNLHSGDREKQNAYHEFFIVMQADEGVPFRLDWLEVGGSVKNPVPFWFDEHRSLSSAVTGIVLRKPPMPEKGGLDGDVKPPTEEEGAPSETPLPDDGGGTTIVNHELGGCAFGGREGAQWSWLLLSLVGLCRRARREP
jgi:hypothetical protein